MLLVNNLVAWVFPYQLLTFPIPRVSDHLLLIKTYLSKHALNETNKPKSTNTRKSKYYFMLKANLRDNVENKINVRKTNEKGLKTLSFNDKDKIKGTVNSTKFDFLVYKCGFSLKWTVP